MVASAAAVLMLPVAGCDVSDGESPRADQGQPSGAGRGGQGSQERSRRQPGPLQHLPEMPSARRAGTLARRLADVEAVLRDPDAAAKAVRRAGEFEQLAVRLLATSPEDVARPVLIAVPPPARVKVSSDVEAARLLGAMTAPQPKLPDWRIVRPPPPRVLLGYYRRAEQRVGVPWEYLAAVHLVETRMGRIRGTSTAGAQGPMQFLPSTWAIYGAGGDINDPQDAILAAARLLKANGGTADMAAALWHYNPSDNYVGAVLRYAEQMRRRPSAYRGYWHWRVLYKHVKGTFVLDVGYPKVPAARLG